MTDNDVDRFLSPQNKKNKHQNNPLFVDCQFLSNCSNFFATQASVKLGKMESFHESNSCR